MPQHFMHRLLIVANIAIIGAVLLAIAAVPSGPFVAVLMPPGTSAEDTAAAVAMAGGTLVAPARFGWIVIARSGEADFAPRLRKAGAWALLNAKIVSICGPGADELAGKL